MFRAVLVAVLAVVVFASAADAAPIPLRHDRDATAIALAGADVVVLSERGKGRMDVVALPRTGGPARTLLSVRDAGLSYDENQLAASADRVAVIVESEGTKKRPDEHRVYSGPPSGPLPVVRRTPDPHGDAWTPYVVSVDGDRMLLVEGIPSATADEEGDEEPVDAGPVRVQILDRSGWTPVPWASSKRVPVAIAGPYAVVAAYEPRRVEVVDVATGSPLTTLSGEASALDLAADGRVAFTAQGQVQLAALGQPQRVLPDSSKLASPRIAGGSIVGLNGERNTLDLLGADGSRSALGPPSLVRTDVEADERGVAWLFNGCVRYAPLDGAARTARGAPCPTSEVALYGIAGSSKLRGRTARVPVRCVTAAGGRCRGRLVVRLDYGTPIVARGRFDIPAGDRWVKVPVRFDRRTVAKFHREEGGSALVNAKLRDGTVGSGGDYSAEFGVEVDDRS